MIHSNAFLLQHSYHDILPCQSSLRLVSQRCSLGIDSCTKLLVEHVETIAIVLDHAKVVDDVLGILLVQVGARHFICYPTSAQRKVTAFICNSQTFVCEILFVVDFYLYFCAILLPKSFYKR